MKSKTIVKPNGNQLVVEYGIQKTNHSYFSITGSLYEGNGRRDRDYITGGAIHEEILKTAPEFSDLVALHLSNEDGTPMYAVENGFYYYSAKHPDANTWFDTLRNHLRIDIQECNELVAKLDAAKNPKLHFENYVESQKARWANEAKAAIEKYGLTQTA